MLSALSVHWRFLWLVAASLIAGVMNAMAGGGSFISFPAMLGVGVPPIEANATNTVALWPGQLTSLATLRGDVRRSILPVVLHYLVGRRRRGRGGAAAHPTADLHASDPWLLLTGALIFGVSGRISRWLRARSVHAAAEHHHRAADSRAGAVRLAVSRCFYIGYFGAGGGFLVMTILALFGMEDMHRLNAMKVVAACASNFCAIVTFIVSGRILWHYCLVSMVFAGPGGYIGARYARAHEPGGAARGRGRYRRGDCGLFFLEGSLSLLLATTLAHDRASGSNGRALRRRSARRRPSCRS